MQERFLTKWTLIIFVLMLTSFPFYAFSEVNECTMIAIFEEQINQAKEELDDLIDIKDIRSEAETLLSRLGDNRDSHEILLLAEALEEEAREYRSTAKLNATGAAPLGLGSVILAGYIVRKTAQNPTGLRLRTRLFQTAILPESGQRLRQYGFNATLVFSIAGTLFLTREHYKNTSQANYLARVIERLEQLNIRASDINRYKERIEQLEIRLRELIIDLEDQGKIEFNGNEIRCTQ